MTSRGAAAQRPQIRLLWDELLSPKVPQALRVLGYSVSHIGHPTDNQPVRGSTDQQIVEHALQTNTVIVTSNHDMMQICAEAGQRFIWLDPRGRQLTRAKQLLLVLEQIDDWNSIVESNSTDCVHARRTGCRPIKPAEAARLATQRMRANERKNAEQRPHRVRAAHCWRTTCRRRDQLGQQPFRLDPQPLGGFGVEGVGLHPTTAIVR